VFQLHLLAVFVSLPSKQLASLTHGRNQHTFRLLIFSLLPVVVVVVHVTPVVVVQVASFS
jgi:hypothetical protein